MTHTLHEEQTVASPPAEAGPAVRGSRAVAFFGAWMLTGLFIDGWAHQAEKPETFFSPWHGVLYSGFVAALLWFAWDGRPGRSRVGATVDRLATTGLVLFVAGAIGDGVWHEIFGIEVDVEALLSPTHLSLMIGGTLMVSAPFRVGWQWLPSRPSFRQFLPSLASATLVTALVLFFLMYLTAAEPIARAGDEDAQGWGIASVLVRTTVLMAPTLLILRRWTPPFGSFTVLFSVTAVALAGLDAFGASALVLPFVAGGLVADIAVARGWGGDRRSQLVGVVVPAACWLSYFAVHAGIWGVHWPAEVWTGAVVFACLTGSGLALLTTGLAPNLRQ